MKNSEGLKLLFNGGSSILICILLGVFCGFVFVDAPDSLTSEQAKQWKLAMGFGYGLFASVIPVLYFVARYLKHIKK